MDDDFSKILKHLSDIQTQVLLVWCAFWAGGMIARQRQDFHCQFEALCLYDNRFIEFKLWSDQHLKIIEIFLLRSPLAGMSSLQASSSWGHVPHYESECGFVVREISQSHNLSSCRCQLATEIERFDTLVGLFLWELENQHSLSYG